MKTKLSLLLVTAMILSLIFSGCTSTQTQKPADTGKTDTKPSSESPANSEVKSVKVGAILPLSGSAAATGVKLKYAVEVAQEIINGEHPEIALPLAKEMGLPNLGNAKIEVVFADHQGNPEVAKSEAE